MEGNVQIKIDLFRCCHSVSHEMAVLGALEAHEMACSDMSEIPNLSVLDVWVTGVHLPAYCLTQMHTLFTVIGCNLLWCFLVLRVDLQRKERCLAFYAGLHPQD